MRSTMMKENPKTRNLPVRLKRRRLHVLIAAAVGLSLIAGWMMLAYSGSSRSATQQKTAIDSIVSPASFSVASKEFIYGPGGKLLSTEEAQSSTCTYSITPTSTFYSVTGDKGIVNLTASSGCNWSASSNSPDWLTITSATSGSGSAAISYVVGDNDTKSARQGLLTIAGLTFTVTQDGGLDGDCTYVTSPAFESFGASGGTGSVNVSCSIRCAWQAVSDASWVTVTSGCCGIGNGTVTYSVATNTSGFHRVATITIAGSTFIVKQKP